MPYTDIVVHLDSADSAARYRIAAAIAARSNGYLTGIYAKTTLINQYNNIGCLGYLPPADLDNLIREHDRGQEDAAAKAATAFEQAAAQADVECGWMVVNGDTPGDMVARARAADLTVVPPPTPSPAYNVHASAVDIAMGGGGPVLVVPDAVQSLSIGERVMVAWKSGREAARALRDAIPLFAAGARVEVRIARPKAAADDGGPEILRRHLERHGFSANVVTVADEGQSIGAWLQSEASAAGCDLLVMGLYGHARLQEFVLGGVSREMLHAASLPLLISH